MAKLPDEMYWRYKKQEPPQEEYPGMNGEVKTFYVCSKCKLDCKTRKELDLHWLDEHGD